MNPKLTGSVPLPPSATPSWRIWPTLVALCFSSLVVANGAITEFPSTQGITINDNTTATPYPSPVVVSGVTGLVTAVRVKINGFTHAYPDDVDVFLVAPSGQVSTVFSDAGGSNSVTDLNLVFDDTAGSAIPNSGGITSGSYLPANYTATEPLPPGGTGSIGTGLTALASSGVNGVWKLFVSDDKASDSGSITSWAIVIETGSPAPEISIEQPLGTPLVGSPLAAFASQSPGTTSSPKTFTVNNAGTALLTVSGVSIFGGDSGEFALNTDGMLTNIPAGGHTTFSVTFSPSGLGLRTTTLQVLSNDADEASTDINLLASGAYSGPKIAIEQPSGTPLANAASVSFEEQSITTTGVLKTFVIKNSGSNTLNITGVSTAGGASGEFVVNTTGMLSSIPSSSQTTFSVAFVPTALGTRSTTLRVLSNDPGAATFDITLTGTGTPPPPAHELVTSFTEPPQNPGYGALVAGGDGYFWGTTENGGVFGGGTIYRVKTDGSDWQTVLSFTNVPQSGNGPTNEGFWPQGGLVNDGAGFLWGTTKSGGGYFQGPNFYVTNGTIFKVQVSNGELTTVARFNPATTTDSIGATPYAGLAADGLGNFWGTTTRAGASDCGTIYKVNATTGVITTVAEFTGQTGAKKGAMANGVLVNDGAGQFWGTTAEGGTGNYGTIYKVNMATGAFATVVEFTSNGATNKGANPYGGLVSGGGGLLWGTTQNGGSHGNGTIFKVTTSSSVLTTVVEFTDQGTSNRGSHPLAGLVNDGAGNFWGTTSHGADSGGGSIAGTVFKLNAGTGVLTSLVEFTFAETVYKGALPRAGLVSDGAGFFWGTTRVRGRGDDGTVFKINAISETLTTVVEFGVRTYRPDGRLVGDSDGNLWGVTERGGLTSSAGTIYKVNLSTGLRSTVVEFGGIAAGTNGGQPNGGLINDGAGNLWGTTYSGGASGYGTVFKVNTSTGVLGTVIHFTGSGAGNNGSGPAAGLMNDGAGYFWGTTQYGGVNGKGTVFKVNASTGALTKVAEFTSNGTSSGPPFPLGELISDGAGFVWGTTEGNINNSTDYGTVYKVNVSTGVLTTVVAFTGTTGANLGSNPACALVNDGAGFLWGTTSGAAINTGGRIFKVNLSTGVLSNIATASLPLAGLVNDGAGFLWGTDAFGGGFYGSVFKVSINTGVKTNIVSFSGVAGLAPGFKPWHGALLKHSDGNFYGTTSEWGPDGGGTLFRLRFGPSPVTQPATAVSNTSATLNGSINPNGAATTADFEWGTSPTLVTFNTRSAGTIAYGTTPVAVSATLSGLTTGNTYYYRTKGLNANNTTPQYGAIQSFIAQGTGPTPLESWRQTWFGNTSNSGDAADLFDYDKDGLVNLVEFALGLNPKLVSSNKIPPGQINGGNFVMTFEQPAGVSGISYGAEWSTTLTGPWNPITDTGTLPQHTFSVPIGGRTKLFVRLLVTTT